MINIDWTNIKVLILDVDGTLYNQSVLRKKMLYQLMKYYLKRPFQIRDLLILHHFRACREEKAGYLGHNLEEEQYEWCAEKTKYSIAKIKSVVKKWMFDFPNDYLSDCAYPGVSECINYLKKHGVKIIIYSDYEARKKLAALNIRADIVIAATDKNINSLKPNPKALLYILENQNITAHESLYIGDRDELDGLCAASAGIPYINLKDEKFKINEFYEQLLSSFKNLR